MLSVWKLKPLPPGNGHTEYNSEQNQAIFNALDKNSTTVRRKGTEQHSDYATAEQTSTSGSTLGRNKKFSPFHSVQTSSWTTLYPIRRLWGNLFFGIKQPGREGDHLPQTSAKVKNAWSYTPNSQMSSRHAHGQLSL
jgi:hypothetical protein